MTVARSASYGSQAFGDEEAPMKESAYRSEYMAEEADDVFAELDAMVADMDEPYAGLQDQKKRRDSRKPSTPSFQDLRLGSYHAARSDIARGKLRASTREERYMAIFARSELVANFRVDQIITQAEQVAMMAAHQSMPHGTTDVRSAAGYFDHVYTTHDTVDVPSDHTYHSVPVSAMEAACELRYVTVPREAQHVFREAELSNPHRAPMLSGPAEIYVGDEYVLTTTLPTVAPMGKFRLGLGVEQAIKCARNTSYREERSGRAVVATAELHHEIRIELVNNLERAITCDVRERIPQPAPDAEVVIEELEVSPAWQEYDQSERHHVLHGGRIWHLEIEPGEHVELLAHYVVKIYANNEITGGNRRES